MKECDSSPNITFLLIIWEFHIMYPNNSHFQVLPGLPSTLVTSPQKRREKRKQQVQFLLPIHSLKHGQTPSVQPLWVLTCQPRPPEVKKSYTSLQYLYHTFQWLSSVFSSLCCFFRGSGGGQSLSLKSSMWEHTLSVDSLSIEKSCQYRLGTSSADIAAVMRNPSMRFYAF